MTPRTNQSPSLDNAPPPGDDEDEERPTHTSEIGTLKKLPNHGTAWLGSSSGVYFVNTVRRAFSTAFAATQAVPASEDILTGEDAEGRSYNGPLLEGSSTTDTFPALLSTSLGRLPDRKIAMELIMSFFQTWHPIFPMLHGPSFLMDMELLYAAERPTPPNFSGNPATKTPDNTPPIDVRKIVTFQLIINVASLDRTDIQLPLESRIRSTADVTRVAGSLALDHDIATLQTLLAAQLYLVATLAIRPASTVGGIIVKLIYHAGLHRCPLRYAQLSEAACDIRKRIFWTAYVLDRHCSLSLGDPNTIQDDDIDVCLSGRELHKAVARDLLAHPEHEINLHRNDPALRTGGLADGPVQDDPRISAEKRPEAREKSLREAALISYVHWSKLTGRIIEIFHKSINHRFPKHEQIVDLTLDIETWWNDLPSFLTGDDSHNHNPVDVPPPDGTTPQLGHLSSFFKIAYHRLLLLLSRPRLSLDQTTPEFQYGLQVCIRASRNILAGMKAHKNAGQSMFLPGLLSAAWMSGLIIAFACQLGKYPKARACA
jgi:Fungal specific transcription factor domain